MGGLSPNISPETTAVTSKRIRMVMLYMLTLSMVSLPTSLARHLLVETASNQIGDDYLRRRLPTDPPPIYDYTAPHYDYNNAEGASGKFLFVEDTENISGCEKRTKNKNMKQHSCKAIKITTDNIEDSFKNSAELELFPGSNVILKEKAFTPMTFSTVYMFTVRYKGQGGTGTLNKSKKDGSLQFGDSKPYNMKCENEHTFYSLEKCGSGLCVYEIDLYVKGRT